MDKIRYPSLNGLRAFSIFFVLFHHLGLRNNIFAGTAGVPWLEQFTVFIRDGQLGVNVFFVISGFLITSLLLNEEAETGKISLKNFYIRRTLRIFPAYYFLLLVYFVLQRFGVISISDASWITAITYTKYTNWYTDWYTSHAWSLSIEEQFYICWPLIFLSGKRIRTIMILGLMFVVPFLRYYAKTRHIAFMNDLTIFVRIDAIATGCLFALYKDLIVKMLSPHWAKLFYGAIICLFLLEFIPDVAGNTVMQYAVIPFATTDGTIANLLIAIILMYSVFGPRKLWFKLLNLKFINYFGLLSYSLYLWQQFFINDTGQWYTRFPQNIGCIFIVALFSYYVIERPFNKLKARFSQNK